MQFSNRILISLLVVLISACSPSINNNEVNVSRFTELGDGSVNSWILEEKNGLIIIDAQRSLSMGEKLADEIETYGKPVYAILLTHPHPDHFGGLAVLQNRFPDAPIVSSEVTRRIMQNDENGFIALTKQALGNDAPETQPIPSSTFEGGETLEWGDITLTVEEIGQGEADSMSLFFEPNQNWLFIGDVADNGMTPFLMEGHTTEWVRQLEELQTTYAERTELTLFPGHGGQGGVELFGKTKGLILWVRSAISEAIEIGLTEAEIDQIVGYYEEVYPDHPAVAAIPQLMRENIKAVAAELYQTQ